ncbi:cysteine protease [Lithospermum erythrorhizon]|uniref:Ubiquitin thioesterase OTU n=1 Tax=Lithospermum erythrorhizon TaxID=34254 RepID=A0AAV3Q2X5_LITER
MLGVLCGRPKAWLFGFHHRLIKNVGNFHLNINSLPVFRSVVVDRRRHHSTNCSLQAGSGAASIWHAILPCGRGGWGDNINKSVVIGANEVMRKGEGSWNAAWDARPARWLHNPNSAWLLFGVCGCLASFPPPHFVSIASGFDCSDPKLEGACRSDEVVSSNLVKCDVEEVEVDQSSENSNYKVKGVPADGRCLFRAIAHMACLRNGEEAPDENLQKELADKLRAQVVDELTRRREEAEWFIEGDFDAYVKRIQQPYVWGGEPELLMASHVLKAPISVFMSDRSSSELTKIANYGEDYKKDDESAINVLFHGYGHYDILEIVNQ